MRGRLLACAAAAHALGDSCWGRAGVLMRRVPGLRPLTMSVAEPPETKTKTAAPARVPVTLLSGFLGAGKTTLLQQLLKSAQDSSLRVGVVVNDVASVNVDSKLVRSPFEEETGEIRATPVRGNAEFVELGDGCICCTIADELMTTLAQLASISQMRGFAYDHVVIEATGVAEPRSIRDLFQDAQAEAIPLMDVVQLDTLVTVVDSAAFLTAYADTRAIAERPDLAAASDDPSAVLMSRFDGSLQRAVVDLLLEQVEVADVILLNKADLLGPADLEKLEAIVSALNGNAKVLRCSYGDAPLESVLATANALGAAASGPVDEHKMAVAASLDRAKERVKDDRSRADAEVDHSRAEEDSHSHSHAHAEEDSHSHSHAHAEEDSHSNCGSNCDSHSHSAHDHAEEDSHSNCGSNCDSHSHSHSAHDHDHDHGRPSSVTTARDRFGIDSFVYSRRRPFAPARLERVLSLLPASTVSQQQQQRGWLPIEEPRDDAELETALAALLRSKGFMWLATSHSAAYYWSHAGKHFDAPILGRWWDTLPREYWPQEHAAEIQADFQGEDGDRRQEIVFIGIDVLKKRATIETALDACLVTDDELRQYREADDDARRSTFQWSFGSNVA
ncbi:hypothetical protein CTAYLR_010458 [Chrysophaeum taylorii]|uniref:CobW C-terminal domain-containing protein n=1 Tax=Chrysophaeum taylorii TaxID=2483200 RepID=A0AAD7U7V0_9STRA|nr:hypothetical protein CTAYLR_010458 [Chrysophaeum taylorii]